MQTANKDYVHGHRILHWLQITQEPAISIVVQTPILEILIHDNIQIGESHNEIDDD